MSATPPHSPAPLGRHLLADLYGISAAALADEILLENMLLDALRRAGFNVLNCATHKFPGEQSGVTSLVLLCESHAAIHTYPELEYLALDIFSCGETDPWDVLERLRQQLRPRDARVRCHPRGPLPAAAVENSPHP